jgi:uncharacterized membrane protein
MSQTHVTLAMRLLMAAFYLVAGIMHLIAPSGFIRIVPGFLSWPEFIILFTGICEIEGAAGLMYPPLRKAAAFGLAA